MRRSLSRQALAASLVLAIVLACAWGCSLFTKLDVDGYTAADAASGASDANYCLPLFDVCATVSFSCKSKEDCEGGAACCLTLASSTSFAYTCCQLPVNGEAGMGGE